MHSSNYDADTKITKMSLRNQAQIVLLQEEYIVVAS